jgi:HEAT repeat protein
MIGWMAALAIMALTPLVYAQDAPADSDSEARAMRFALSEGELKADVSLERGDVEDGESKWRLVVREQAATDGGESAKVLSTIPVPNWVGRTHYGFDVETAEVDDNHFVVLFSATPGASADPPPSAPDFKAAWLVHEEREQNMRWRHVGSTQYSELDGGSRMSIRRPDGAAELIRFSPDAAERFCGVLDTDTFAFERFVVDENRFLTDFDVDALVDTAKPLDARLGDPEFTPPMLQGWFQWFIASSDARTPDEEESLIRPLELGDFRLEVGWSEGVEGLGRGEFVTAQINNAVPMTAIRIFPGDGASAERYRASATPRTLLVALQNGERFTFDVPSADYQTMVDRHGITIELPEPVTTGCMTIVLLDSEQGEPAGDAPDSLATAVTMAEATPYSTLHGSSPQETAQNLVDFVASSDSVRKRERVSELGLTIGEPLVEAVLEKMRQGTPAERRRVIPLLASIPADEAVPLLADYLEHFGPGDEEYRAVKRALAAHHRNSSSTLVAYVRSMDDPTSRKYVDMVRLLGRVGDPDDIAILIDDLGQGDARVRNERIRAIAKAGEALVGRLVEAAAREPNSTESHDAFKALNLIGRQIHYTDQGTLSAPDIYLEAVRKTQKRRTLMRALRVAKYFYADGFVGLVADEFADHPDPLVQREAIAALARYPDDHALELVLDAMSDRSPDVRIAAAETMGEREDAADAVGELEAYVARERWTAGLQEAFETLARVENERTDGIFLRLLDEQPNADATLIALRALNRRERALPGAAVVEALESDVTRAQTRLELVDNLGFDDSKAAHSWLVGVATKKAKSDASPDAKKARDVRRMRRHAILALGRQRTEAGRRVLLELARTTEDDDVRQVAIRSLGFFASAELLESLREWHREAEPGLREQLDDTIDMIDRRISIDEAEANVDEAIEDIEQAESGDSSE